MELATAGECTVIPYEYVKDSSPAALQTRLSQALSLPIEAPLDDADTYEALMLRMGKGSTSDQLQSNIPNEARRELLEAARHEVHLQVGEQQRAALDELYQSASAMSAFGTVEPA